MLTLIKRSLQSVIISGCAISLAYSYPFYAGIRGGFGSTTWKGLVPRQENQNFALNISTPLEVKEGGGLWGAIVGYEFTPHFAIEAAYQHYPYARVNYDADSLFAFDNNDSTRFITATETASLMGKIFVNFADTNVRVYSSAGVANIHRNDQILHHWILSPTFGVGFNYNFSEHFMGELGANYAAGYGESELSPADDFIPFLYSIFFSIAYRF